MSLESDEDRLPTGLWVDAQCAQLNSRGQAYYVMRRGNHHSGVVFVKIYDVTNRVCIAYIQQRNFDGELGWVYALGDKPLAESEVDQYIQRALVSDPDMWVIEIEAQSLDNPFEGNLFDEFG